MVLKSQLSGVFLRNFIGLYMNIGFVLKTIEFDISFIKNRLFHDFGKEVVVFLSSCTLLALFLFIFSDFLESQIGKIPAHALDLAKSSATLALCLYGALRSFQTTRTRSHLNRMAFLKYIGSHENQIAVNRIWIVISRALIYNGIALGLALLAFDLPLLPLGGLLLVATTAISGGLAYTLEPEAWTGFENSSSSNQGPSIGPVIWRYRQLIHKRARPRVAIAISYAIFALGIIVRLTSQNLILAFPLFCIAGICLSVALCTQVTEDLKWASFEQALGMTHECFIQTYLKLAGILMIPMFTMVLLFILWSLGTSKSSIVEAGLELLKISAIVGSFTLLTPALIFQIDARRPTAQIISIILIGLFLSTAVLAHPFAVILIPIAMQVLMQQQNGLYYRA
jgi:hypothetical protein